MKTIVLIEDDELVRDTVTDLLEFNGYEVISAGGGQEGMNIIRQRQPDLILCDIMMPGINGIDIIRAIKKENKTESIPFIFLSAKSRKEDLKKGMMEGANDYIIKPFGNSILMEKISKLIG